MILPYPIHLTPTARVRLAALAAGYLIAALIGLHQYLTPFTAEILLGTIAVKTTWDGRPGARSAAAYACAGLVFTLLYCYVASKSVLFAAIAMSLLSLIHSICGKPGWPATVCLLLMTPLFDYFSNVFSFPLRLGLTRLAGRALTAMGTDFHTEGNMLVNGNAEFSVDPACMGLRMLSTSLLTGFILTGVYQKKSGQRLTIRAVACLMTSLLLLNLGSNVFRIIVLVWFRIPPEAPLHSAVGLACFAGYVLLPGWWIIRKAVRRFGKPFVPEQPTGTMRDLSYPILLRHMFLLVLIAVAMLQAVGKSPNDNLRLSPLVAPGYTIEELHDRIAKLTDGQSLIYIKPIAGFYSPDHQPGICWTGSGYAFKDVVEKSLGGTYCYMARLEKDSDVLYSAWWYDNGFSTTTSQWIWRRDALLHSHNYALVNVTASTPEKLETAIRKFLLSDPCKTMLTAGNGATR